MINKYKIVEANNTAELENKVNDLIRNEGWQPHGNMTKVFHEHTNEMGFYQPMVNSKVKPWDE